MMRWIGRGVAAAATAALSLATGCAGFFVYPGSLNGSSSSTSAAGDYVYVANATAQSLTAFTVGTGTLASGTSYGLGFTPTAVAVNPADTIVFVAGTNGVLGYIDAFAIGSSGALTLLISNNVGSADEVSMDISPDGDWLLGLDANALTIDEYSINSTTGQLTLGTGASYTFPSGAGTVVPLALKFAPNEENVYAALGTAGDLMFGFNNANNLGTLSLSQTLTLASGSGTSDNALAVSANSSYVFIARSNGTNSTLVAMSNGLLNQVSSVATGTQPYSVVLNSAGTDAYVADRGANTISGYSVSSSGGLTALSTYASGSQVTALAADKSGDYLLAAANGGSPDLTMYSFDSSGNLVTATTSTTGTDPTGPVAIAATH